jgi:hypothetical protein
MVGECEGLNCVLCALAFLYAHAQTCSGGGRGVRGDGGRGGKKSAAVTYVPVYAGEQQQQVKRESVIRYHIEIWHAVVASSAICRPVGVGGGGGGQTADVHHTAQHLTSMVDRQCTKKEALKAFCDHIVKEN